MAMRVVRALRVAPLKSGSGRAVKWGSATEGQRLLFGNRDRLGIDEGFSSWSPSFERSSLPSHRRENSLDDRESPHGSIANHRLTAWAKSGSFWKLVD